MTAGGQAHRDTTVVGVGFEDTEYPRAVTGVAAGVTYDTGERIVTFAACHLP